MKRKHMVSSLVAAVGAFIIPISNAAVVYQYTGNNYTNLWTTPSVYDTSMSISGSIAVDSKFINFNGDITSQVNSYSFTDGVQTFSGTNPSQILVNTDGAGNITNWSFQIYAIPYDDLSLMPGDTNTAIYSGISGDQVYKYHCDFYVNGCVYSTVDGAYNSTQGAWSIVPLPASLWLFGSGLAGIIGITRKKAA